MADSRVSTWTAKTTLDGTEILAAEDGANFRQITTETVREHVALKHGEIVVTTADGAVAFSQCTADGTSDDRTTIETALNAARDSMPATVEFGPGDYGIFGGVEVKPVQGSRGLTIRGQGAGVTRIRFTKGSQLSGGQQVAIRIEPSVDAGTTTANYIHDVVIEGIAFYDDDFVAHLGAGSEESHGIMMVQCYGFQVRDCHMLDIGDEGIDITQCVNGIVSNNTIVNTPSLGTAGAGISVSQGSLKVVISNNVIQSSATRGTQSTVSLSSAISIANVGSATKDDMEDIVVSNNVMEDCIYGLLLNLADTTSQSDINGVVLDGNTIRGTDFGIKAQGSNGQYTGISIVGNFIDTCDDTGIDFDLAAATNLDFNLSFNTIRDCTTAGITANGTCGMIAGNLIKSCTRGIHIFAGDDIQITGGLFDDCGGSNLEEIEAETATQISVVGVKITNSNVTASNIRGAEEVHNCTIESAQTGTFYNSIHNFTNATGNQLNRGMRPTSTATQGVIANNVIKYLGTEGGGANSREAIILAAGNDDYIISGNSIDTSAALNNQYCIELASGCTNTLIIGNNLKATTAGSTNTVNDLGTGTKFETTNNNVST